MTSELIYNAIRVLQDDIHESNVAAGWWTDPVTGDNLKSAANLKTTIGWKLLLSICECAEAAEGCRKDIMDDKLPHRKMMEVELADAIIRILDLGGACGYDIASAIKEKREYNAIRPDHKPENRAKEGGKAF